MAAIHNQLNPNANSYWDSMVLRVVSNYRGLGAAILFLPAGIQANSDTFPSHNPSVNMSAQLSRHSGKLLTVSYDVRAIVFEDNGLTTRRTETKGALWEAPGNKEKANFYLT